MCIHERRRWHIASCKNREATSLMYVIVWTYHVKPGRAAEFEKHYSATGTWVQFLRGGDGFVGTELLCDPRNAGTYATIDRWESREKYDTFRTAKLDEYEAIDAVCDALTDSEIHVGSFDTRE